MPNISHVIVGFIISELIYPIIFFLVELVRVTGTEAMFGITYEMRDYPGSPFAFSVIIIWIYLTFVRQGAAEAAAKWIFAKQ